jgi:hypothetical protein
MKKGLKRLIKAVLILCVLMCTLLFFVVNPIFSGGEIEDRVTSQEQRLKDDVFALCETDGPRTHYNLNGLNEAADYIKNEFQATGLRVSEQTFETDGQTYRNIIASCGPANAERWIIGAHYDVCGDQPGADDNASGVAGLLEIARMIGEEQPTLNYRIDFVAYTLEEPPYFRTAQMGSAQHASQLVLDSVEVAGMICLEMIGYFTDEPRSQTYPAGILEWIYPTTGNFITVIGQFDAPFFTRGIKKDMAAACTVDVWSMNAPSFVPGIDFSDHLNYWAHDIPAVMVTNTAFYRNDQYHQPNDTPERLDYARMSEVVNGVYWAAVNRE